VCRARSTCEDRCTEAIGPRGKGRGEAPGPILAEGPPTLVQRSKSRSRRPGLVALVVSLLALLARAAAADPQSLTGAYSDYEQQAIRDARETLGGALDPSPEG